MKKYNISTNLVQVIKNLYNKATSAILFNSSIGDWFQTTVGVRQGSLLSPTLFNIFLERIMTDALEDHEGTVSIGGRAVTNLCFADDIDGLAGEEELAKIFERLDKASTAYGMEISAEMTKLMTTPVALADYSRRPLCWRSMIDLGVCTKSSCSVKLQKNCLGYMCIKEVFRRVHAVIFFSI